MSTALQNRRTLVAVALTLVVAAVIGLIYLQVSNEMRATRSAWLVTRDLPAGSLLENSNVRQVRVPETGDQFVLLQDQPFGKRVSHAVAAQSLLTPADVYTKDLTEVPVSLRAAPNVHSGDTIDVYAVVGNRTILVGRSLVVVAAGNPLTVLVPAADEPAWITLQANNVPLFAAKGSGLGVPNTSSISATDAVASLSATAGALPASSLASPQPSPSSSPR